ncbi:hypothetical protein EON82_11685 [bacterium]|nr:MAG: hypothetical protein EON82_11685 [bacterium]
MGHARREALRALPRRGLLAPPRLSLQTGGRGRCAASRREGRSVRLSADAAYPRGSAGHRLPHPGSYGIPAGQDRKVIGRRSGSGRLYEFRKDGTGEFFERGGDKIGTPYRWGSREGRLYLRHQAKGDWPLEIDDYRVSKEERVLRVTHELSESDAMRPELSRVGSGVE